MSTQLPGDDILLQVNGLKKHFPIHGGFLRRVVGQVKAVDGINLGATNLVGNSTKRPYLVEQPDPLANVTASIPLQVARQVRIQ